jgi:hypothetical protein
MSTDMSGIYQQSLFAKATSVSVRVSEQNRYRVLAEVLPWQELAEVANKYRSEKVSIVNGRRLNMRLHLGAYVGQSMNNWTDQMTEEMVRLHGGMRVLCGVQESTEDIDRTSIEKFRNMVGPDGAEELNQHIVRAAVGAGFSGSEICSSDTTVQEAPIQHPTEVGHMKKISEKLLGIGKAIGGKVGKATKSLAAEAQKIFTTIRLFTRGKHEAAVTAKKELSKKMHKTVSKMLRLVQAQGAQLPKKIRAQVQSKSELYDLMLKQIIQWVKTGQHPAGKLISLWNLEARAIARNKSAKMTEFGRRWIITRILGGYLIGAPCQKLGGDADVKIADEVLINFLNTVGEVPENFVYDRGGDGEKNHDLLKAVGVKNNCIFPKGSNEKMNVTPSVFEMARRERALSEAGIATIKHNKYGFNKPRARSTQSCTTKGQMAMFGFNINHLFRDLSKVGMVSLEIT